MNQRTEDLQNRIVNFLKTKKPIVADNGYSAQISDIKVTIPPAFEDLKQQTALKYNSGSLTGTVKGSLVIKEPGGKVTSKSPSVILLKFPLFTDRGTIITNGHEKFIQNQLRVLPGSYTTQNNAKGETRTELKFARSMTGRNMMPKVFFIFDPKSTTCKVEIKGVGGADSASINATTFLRELGYTDPEIAKIFGNGEIADSLLRAPKGSKKSISQIYELFTGSEPKEGSSDESIRKELFDYFEANARFTNGESIVSTNLGLNNHSSKYFSKDVIRKGLAKTIAVAEGSMPVDEKDDLRFAQVVNGADLILEQIEKDYRVFERSTLAELKEKGISSPNAAKTFRPILKFGKSVNDFVANSGIVQSVADDANLLTVESAKREVTQYGDRYALADVYSGKDDDESKNAKRDLAFSDFNKIDPVEVGENQRIGFIQHLSQGANVKNGTIYNKYYVVKRGSASTKDNALKELSVNEAENAKIAFFDERYMNFDPKAGKITLKRGKVRARYKGKPDMISADEIQYIDFSPNDVLGTVSNMVPFVSHDDGSRILMACNQQKQAVPLVNREAPIVETVADRRTGETYEEKIGREYGKPVISSVDGVVAAITDNEITVKDASGKRHKHQYYNYYPFNGTYITNELKVKKGESVRKGQILAEGWQTKEGKLSLGVNANIMYLPYKGYNYEDGIVVSQSFANRMASEEVEEKEVFIPKTAVGGRGSNVLREVVVYSGDSSLSAMLDKDGIVKEGVEVKPGSPLAAWLEPISDNASLEEVVKSADKGGSVKYTDRVKRIEANSYISGKVVRVTVVNNPDATSKQKIVVTVSSTQSLKVGDKLSGRHGNKGTITKILPDTRMPVAKDGTQAEVLLSPLGVPSRKNVGQLFEAAAGLVAKKTGVNEVKVKNFDESEKNKVLEGLKKIGIDDGKMKVYLREEDENGKIHRVPVENPVTVGNMYMLKLKHKVDDKIQGRSNLETAPDEKNFMPAKQVGRAKGEKHNPQALGEMEFRALIGHEAVHNILESSTLKSDGGGDVSKRVALFNALSSGKINPNDLDYAATPETLNTLSGHLKALGLNVKPLHKNQEVSSFDDAFDSLSLVPLNTNQFAKLLGEDKAVNKSSVFEARTLAAGKQTPISGGLMDEKIFGGSDEPDSRSKWGYIRLAQPVANPIFAKQNNAGNLYSLVTGKTNRDIMTICKGNKVIITDPKNYSGFKGLDAKTKAKYLEEMEEALQENGWKVGDLVEVEKIDKLRREGVLIPYAAGGNAIYNLLEKVDLKEELKKAKSNLDKTQKPEEMNKQYRRIRAIQTVMENGGKATDLMLTAIPVTPKHLRPAFFDENKKLINSDLNKLYSDIIKVNEKIKPSVAGIDMDIAIPPREAAKTSASLYETVSNFMGLTEKKDRSRNPVRGVLQNLSGKEGLFRGKLLKKRIDFSGRSVIGVDPNLKLDECALPLDMAKYIYKPFIIDALKKQGRARNNAEANNKWDKADADVKKVLKEIANDRPVLLGRQPSLHKFGVMAFKPIIKDVEDGSIVRTIQLNPLVPPGFGADFDGDQMYATIPVTEKAKEEAKAKMMPSENFINPTNGKMIIEIRMEMLAGLFNLSGNKPKLKNGKALPYNSYSQLYSDYMNGKVNSDTAVKVPISPKPVSAGQAMINWCIPDKVKQGNRNFTKVWDKGAVSKLMERLYRTGEKSEWKTISMSEVGEVFDKLKTLGFNASTRTGVSISVSDFKQVDNVSELYNRRLKETKKKYGNMNEAQIKAWQEVEKQIATDIKAGKTLGPNNDLDRMMRSGAKGDPGQITKMVGTVGVFQNIQGKIVAPVESSYFKGMTPDEYFRQGSEARKGIYDRSVATSGPGALTRQVWHLTQDVVIKEADCGSTDYVTYNKNDTSNLRGRYAAAAVRNAKGKVICKRNQLINDEILELFAKDDSVESIRVRSPLRCKTPNGCCQKCYGSTPGTLVPVKIGSAVGTLAAQALGEPTTQLTMKQFHSGGADAGVAMSVNRIKDILNLSKNSKNPAVLASTSGVVTKIEELPDKTVVWFGSKKQIIKNNPDGTQKILSVKKGDIVKAGDFLTMGSTTDLKNAMGGGALQSLTFADPSKMFEFKAKEEGAEQAQKEVKDYLAESMKFSLSSQKVDGRHIELIVNKLGSDAQIIDPGDSDFMRGQYADKNEVDRFNLNSRRGKDKRIVPLTKPSMIVGRPAAKNYKLNGKLVVKKGQAITPQVVNLFKKTSLNSMEVLPKPAVYNTFMTSREKTTFRRGNWLGNAGFESAGQQLAMGAAIGDVDRLNTPKTRLMTGKMVNVGEGFQQPPNVISNFTGKMYNFFANLGKKK